MTVDPGDQSRQAQLATALGLVRSRIAQACEAAGRDRLEITMVAVTKTYPVADVAALVRLGVLDIGESKEQEARAKLADLDNTGLQNPDLHNPVRLHLIGRLQSNKARSVGAFAHTVHSVDRLKLVRGLADGAAGRTTALDVFVQVSLDGDPERGGAAREDVDELAEAIDQRSELRLRGVMAVPPTEGDPAAGFEQLAAISARLQTDHPHASAISVGMSGDLEQAIAHGSTHLRVGTALLGRREQVFS